MSALDFTAILLAAGRGTRLASQTAEPKVLLDLHGRSLLERHFAAWGAAGFKHAVLVVGHEQQLIRDAVAGLDPPLEITWVDNPEYATKGNTHSMLLGLRAARAGAVVFDADLVYEPGILKRCMDAPGNAIPVGTASIDDLEATKALVDDGGCVRMTVDKRAITAAELARYRFAGEAMGILKFDAPTRGRLMAETEVFLAEPGHAGLNWEQLLNRFLLQHDVACLHEPSGQWVEIDTPGDFARAREKFAPRRGEG